MIEVIVASICSIGGAFFSMVFGYALEAVSRGELSNGSVFISFLLAIALSTSGAALWFSM